jgi:hypothetical protein
MGKRKVKWVAGDNFLVPLNDRSYGHGQVMSYEGRALNSAACAFSSLRFESVVDDLEPVTDENVIAVMFVTRDQLDSGGWRVVNNRPILHWEDTLDMRGLRSRGFVGAIIHGTAIVGNFLSAYHGLLPWNHYLDPEYFDKVLISPDRRPASVILK